MSSSKKKEENIRYSSDILLSTSRDDQVMSELMLSSILIHRPGFSSDVHRFSKLKMQRCDLRGKSGMVADVNRCLML